MSVETTSDQNIASPATIRFASAGYSDLVLRIVREIDDLITEGILQPGQRLIEKDLMRQLGVGRMGVREALRILASDGVIELASHRSARVRQFDTERLIEMLETMIALFGVAMKSFVEREPTREGIAALIQARNDIRDAAATGSIEHTNSCMLKFHKTILRYSGNVYVQELMGRIHIHHHARQITAAYTYEDTIAAAAAYEPLTDQILSGDLKGARDTLERAFGYVAGAIRKNALDRAKQVDREHRSRNKLNSP